MSRRTDAETVALLREIRDLVQVLVLKEMQDSTSLSKLEEMPARKLFSWASIHKLSDPESLQP
jgi:hypothetical protein